MGGYFLSPRTGAKFFVPQFCEWGKELAADGWIWIEPNADFDYLAAAQDVKVQARNLRLMRS